MVIRLNIPVPLASILRDADNEDLDVLVDHITDSGKGRIALDNDICTSLVKAKSDQSYGSKERMLIESELRRFGGNTVANLVRDVRSLFGGVSSLLNGGASANSITAVPYDEIVRDVAEHLKVKFDKHASTPQVEEGILKSLLVASFEKMTPDERAAVLKDIDIPDAAMLARRSVAVMSAAIFAASLNAAMAYQLSRTVATATAQALLGRGLAVGAASVVAQPVALLAGPIGWALTGAWALADMASPAYRVTVPCVVQVAYMRMKARMNSHLPGAFC